MKKITLLTFSLMLIFTPDLLAQWQLGGNNSSTAERIGLNTRYSLIFETDNTERGRITGSGFWGIGTSSPKSRLHFKGDLTTDWGTSFYHYSSSFAEENRKKVWLRRSWNDVIGDFLMLCSSGNRSNTQQSSLILSERGALFGSGTDDRLGLSAEWMRIGNNGSVGIGTSTLSDTRKLEVYTDLGTGIYVTGTYGVDARTNSSGGVGVIGTSINYIGILGAGGTGIVGYGVYGVSPNSHGGHFESENGTGLYARTNKGKYAAYFVGDVFTGGSSYQSSDQNIKKNVQQVRNALSIIEKLKPQMYEFKDEGKFASLHLPKGTHYGLLAQEVEKVLPNLVKESSHSLRDTKPFTPNQVTADGKRAMPEMKEEAGESLSLKAVNYTELIPILIKAVQEQQQTIKTLTEEMRQLKGAKGGGENSQLNTSDIMGVSLEQNYPNPSQQSTTLRYSIPAGAIAQIFVYEASSGNLVQTLKAPATGRVELNTRDFHPGTYIYTLVVNGKLAASKQMLLNQ